jgi:DNA primase
MARTSGPDTIETVKARLSLLDIVQRYIELKQAGSRWMGVCPFHQESKPSLSVNPEQGFYYCFGCQASGDLIDFYCRINGLEFSEGLQELAREAGVEIGQSGGDRARSSERKLCLDINALTQTYFRQSLQGGSGRGAREYLADRGLSDETVELFQLGWGPAQWNGLTNFLKGKGISPQQGVKAGVLSEGRQGRIYDRFRGRVTFPIMDLAGRVVAFGGRTIGDGEPKYLNSSESPIFKKGDFLYGLYQARQQVTQSKEVLLSEGYADVMALVQYGLGNSCGVLGTALTQAQVQRLAGLCRKVILLFDGDRAGRQAALRSAEMILQFGLKADVVELPEGEDVDSLLRHGGRQALERLLDDASDGLAFCLSMITYNHSPKEIMSWATNFLHHLREASWKAFYLPRLAEGLRISEQEMRKALEDHRRTQPRSRPEAKKAPAPAQRDREMLRFAVCYPEYLQALDELGIDGSLKTERGKTFWRKILRYGVSRVLPHLDEGEKRFFVECQIQENDTEEAGLVWEDIRSILIREKRKRERHELYTALARAERSGDQQEVARILRAIQERRGNE